MNKNAEFIKEASNLLKSMQKSIGDIPLRDKINSYTEICEDLDERELIIEDFSFLQDAHDQRRSLARAKLMQIARLVNGKWEADYSDKKQQKWYPYFEYQPGRSLVFLFSSDGLDGFLGLVAFKDEETANMVGKTFIDLFTELL